MRTVVLTLMAVCLLAVLGCDGNDKNTLNPIPKSHYLNPVFSISSDNTSEIVPLGQVRLTVTPDIGWGSEVVSDSMGFISTLASGTFITAIDTTINFPGTDSSDTVADTTYATYSFLPSQSYTFTLHRNSSLQWTYPGVEYARRVDSSWLMHSVTSSYYYIISDPDRFPTRDTVQVDSVAMLENPADTVGNSPDSIYCQPLLYAYWFDTAFVITRPADTIFRPDSIRFDTVVWAFWLGDYKVNTRKITKADSLEDCYWFVDVETGDTTWYCPYQCDIYSFGSWGDYDTVVHTMPGHRKGLIFGIDSLLVYNLVEGENGFAGDTVDALLEITNGITGSIDSTRGASFQITMPATDIYLQPDYLILVK